MVSTDIIVLSIIIGLILIAVGYFIKKRGAYLSLFGSILMTVTGIIMLINPMEFVIGTETLVNGSLYTTTVVYAAQSAGLNSVLSFVILFIGMIGIYLSADYLYNMRYEEDEE